MKTLRLFIDQKLNQSIPWVEVNSDGTTDSGTSTFEELSQFVDVQLEVYLSTDCCSIFKTDITGINSRRLSEELVLGILEEGLVDDINLVKPVMLSVEDNTAYVAIFNREYYEELIDKLTNLGRPIRFLQSFAYTTLYQPDSWTVFLSAEQSFIRTSKHEYYTLDNNKPVPLLLADMVAATKPESLLIYTDGEYDLAQIEKELALPCVDANGKFEYGIPVWNFYNQKSSSFNIKFDSATKKSLLHLLRIVTYLFIACSLFWLLDVVTLEINNYRLKSRLEASLHSIMPGAKINSNTLTNILGSIRTKVEDERHHRGLYADTDAVTILRKFLEIVSNITSDNITQIDYSKKEMLVFVNEGFSPKDFPSYINILAINHISASIEDYKTYAKAKKMADTKKVNNDEDNTDTQISADTAWVITLKPSLLQN